MRPLLERLNHAGLWHRQVRIGPDRFKACSFDRLVYLGWQKLRARRRDNACPWRALLRPGAHVVDIGANLGLYAHRLAEVVGPGGRVTAFEPDPRLFATLRENILLNGRPIRALPYAIGAQTGRALLARGLFNSGDNRVRPATDGNGGRQAEIQIRALDDVLSGEAIDLIKLDIQGWEVEALRGMPRILAANPKIILYLEVWPHGLKQTGTSVTDLFSLLRSFGMRLSSPSGTSVPSPAELTARENQPLWFTDVIARRSV